ncbi:MAG: hypothetical protein K1060chlam2_00111 [Chlamydiae bacterium]|nr:hypothetical protein [Chlamydiota bacterium]
MSIEGYAKSAGYDDLGRLGYHTLFLTSAFTAGSLIIPVFLNNFNLRSHIIFGLIEGASISLLFNNSYIKKIEPKLIERFPEKEAAMETAAKITQFFIIFGLPLLVAKIFTPLFSHRVSWTRMFEVGALYNGGVYLAATHAYVTLTEDKPQEA